MKTLFLLQAQFGGRAEVPLTEICSEFLGLNGQAAKQRAALQQLPLPVHRLGSQKSPWLVSLVDLAEHIDQQREEAREEWRRMNAA